MDAQELRDMQAPLKERYKGDPGAAVITLKAQANGAAGIACKVDTSKGLVEAGLHPATGGDGGQACSGDMLLEALAACAGVTFQAVSTALGVDVRDVTITAEGESRFPRYPRGGERHPRRGSATSGSISPSIRTLRRRRWTK